MDVVNSTIEYYKVEPRALRLDPTYIRVYCIWMNFVFMGLGPFLVLITLNALILRSLITQQSETSMSKKNEIALAKVGLTIAVVFILCHSVKWIPNLYELYRLTLKSKLSWPLWVECITHVSHFVVTLNSSVNFYIYCVKHFNLRGGSDSPDPTAVTLTHLEASRKLSGQVPLIKHERTSNVGAVDV